jgi:hypothetical protein
MFHQLTQSVLALAYLWSQTQPVEHYLFHTPAERQNSRMGHPKASKPVVTFIYSTMVQI